MRRRKSEKQDVPSHVRSEDAPEGQKADSVHKASDSCHSHQGDGSNFLRGWIRNCRSVIHVSSRARRKWNLFAIFPHLAEAHHLKNLISALFLVWYSAALHLAPHV